jgi:hypothetical protein
LRQSDGGERPGLVVDAAVAGKSSRSAVGVLEAVFVAAL